MRIREFRPFAKALAQKWMQQRNWGSISLATLSKSSTLSITPRGRLPPELVEENIDILDTLTNEY